MEMMMIRKIYGLVFIDLYLEYQFSGIEWHLIWDNNAIKTRSKYKKYVLCNVIPLYNSLQGNSMNF